MDQSDHAGGDQRIPGRQSDEFPINKWAASARQGADEDGLALSVEVVDPYRQVFAGLSEPEVKTQFEFTERGDIEVFWRDHAEFGPWRLVSWTFGRALEICIIHCGGGQMDGLGLNWYKVGLLLTKGVPYFCDGANRLSVGIRDEVEGDRVEDISRYPWERHEIYPAVLTRGNTLITEPGQNSGLQRLPRIRPV